MSAPPAQVVLLCGPSGSGKSHIAGRSGLPVFRLDDFYKDGDDATLPFSDELGIVDWDDVGAWHAGRAVDALVTLCRDGSVDVPTYDIGQSRATGSSRFARGAAPAVVAEGVFAAEIVAACRERGILADAVVLHRAPAVVAEGVFAAEIVAACRERGILADAVVLHRAPWKNFVRRFTRDLLERRKPPLTLWRRGRLLMSVEPGLVATAEAKGCRRVDARGLADLLAGLAARVDA